MHIHVVSNSIYLNTGFGKVSRYILLGLKKLGYEVSMTGLQTSQRIDHDYGIDCYPIDSGGHIDEDTQLFINLQKLKPDIMIYVGQVDVDLNHLIKIFDYQIIYCPVEGANISDMMTNDLKNVIKRGGRIVAQCAYGFEEMKKAGIGVSKYIYHGVDPEIFYPIDKDDNEDLDKEAMKLNDIISILRFDKDNKRWIQKDIDIKDLKNELKGNNNRFVYSFLGQNFGVRKQIPRLLNAYSMLIHDSKQIRDRSILALHTLPASIRGVNLIRNIHQLGIQDNIIFTYGSLGHGPLGSAGWSESGMNIWYNLADVNVSASSSEGFGMGTSESMTCGVANIGPECSSFIELIGNDADSNKNRGWLAKIATYHEIQDGSLRALVDEKDLALKMKQAFVEKDKMKVFGKNGMEFMKDYTWDKICKQWDSLLKEMAKGME
jgi:glycosyltransferase involved in cell wall biosynthesis